MVVDLDMRKPKIHLGFNVENVRGMSTILIGKDKPEELKKTSEFRLISKDTMRVELPNKVDGSAKYAIDVQLPGMLYGAVLRAPVEGSAPATRAVARGPRGGCPCAPRSSRWPTTCCLRAGAPRRP